MPTEAELEQLFVRVSELEAWRKVKDGSVQKEVPKEPLAKEASPKGPFPPVPPKPAPKDEDDDWGENQTTKKK